MASLYTNENCNKSSSQTDQQEENSKHSKYFYKGAAREQATSQPQNEQTTPAMGQMGLGRQPAENASPIPGNDNKAKRRNK